MSRRVRLRRTIAGAVTLCLVVVGVVAFTRPDAPQAVAHRVSLASLSGGHDATGQGQGTKSSNAPAVATKQKVSDRGGTTAQKRTSNQDDVTVPHSASGHLRSVPVPGRDSTGPGRTVTYSVEIEQGLGVRTASVARTVRSVLTDKRGWQAKDHVRFVHVTPRQQRAGKHVDIRITLASPKLTDKLCRPLDTMSRLDCFNGWQAVLNDRNWQHGIPAYRGDLRGYRTYLINHEVGHGLGFGHVTCTKKGSPARVMIQQTISLQGCTPWPWPTRP